MVCTRNSILASRKFHRTVQVAFACSFKSYKKSTDGHTSKFRPFSCFVNVGCAA
jgi:hypothetical protein